jgi:hypothetical protein
MFKEAAGSVLSLPGVFEARSKAARGRAGQGTAAGQAGHAGRGKETLSLMRVAPLERADEAWPAPSVRMRCAVRMVRQWPHQLMFDGSGRLIKVDDPATGQPGGVDVLKFSPNQRCDRGFARSW